MRPGLTLEQGMAADELKQIDEACDRFEAAWRAGEQPPMEHFLTDHPDRLRARLLHELLTLELDLRRQQGETPDLDDYRARFPDNLAIVNDVLGSRSRMDGNQLNPWSEVDHPPPAVNGPARFQTSHTAPAHATRPFFRPVQIGSKTNGGMGKESYEILAELGRGGMGIVYKARQIALDRLVALKVIRSQDLASEAELSRFQNEAEAVAQLDHPHIVPIYEVGQMAGQRFFSMKLVSGSGLDKSLGRFASDFKAAARLMVTVALAVHHAHQRGILHRDLKPANILVDEAGEPHVSDFGLARRIESAIDLTHTGYPMGTPSYMSPEQARGDKGSLTTSTDVYGLGSILYALLTGKAPFAGSSLAETLDLVRATPPELPRRINAEVPRDLEIICLKCLEKDPQRRYASAAALAADLNRWLDGKPIEARPAGPLVRTWMWCRRNPLPAALAGLCVLSVVVGLAGVTWKWREAAVARDEENTINSFFNHDLLGQAGLNPRGASLTVGELLDRTSARLGNQFEGRPTVEASIRRTLGTTYQALGLYDKGEPQLRAVVKLDTLTRGEHHRQTLTDVNLWTAILDDDGRYAEAEPLLRKYREITTRGLGPDHPTTLKTEYQLGILLGHVQKLDEAEELLRDCLTRQRRVLGEQHEDTLRSINQLGLLLQDRGKLDEADSLALEYEHGIRCQFGTKHPDNVTALANRGRVRLNQGHLDEAKQFYESAAAEASRILGDSHPRTLAALSDLAAVLQKDGEKTAALSLLHQAWERASASRGQDDLETLKAGCLYARSLIDAGSDHEAAEFVRSLSSQCKRALGPDHPTSREAEDLLQRVRTVR